jgi:hypothetical protein
VLNLYSKNYAFMESAETMMVGEENKNNYDIEYWKCESYENNVWT